MAKYTVSLGDARKALVFDDVRNPLMKVTRTLGGTNNFANKILQFNSDGDLLPVTTPAASIPDGDKGDITTSGSGATWTIDATAVSNSKLANMAQATVKGRAASAGTGDPTDLTADEVSTILDGATDPFLRTSASGGSGITELTGDVTAGPGSGSQAATVANAAITNAKLANMAQDTIKGRASGSGTGAPVDLTATQARAILNVADGANAYVHPNHSGDVTSSGDGATTIANSAVTYAKIQNVSATDKLLGRSSSGAGVVEEIDCTAAGRNLLDDVDAAAQRTTLGLGTMATQAANAVAITGGTVAGLTSLGVSGDTTLGGNILFPVAALWELRANAGVRVHIDYDNTSSGASFSIMADGTTTVFSVGETGNTAIAGTLGVTGATTLSGRLAMAIPSATTIASGSIVVTAARMIADTEGAAASDDLVTATGAANGDWLYLSTANSARDVVVKHGTGTDNFRLVGAADFTLTTSNSMIALERLGNVWNERWRVTL